MQLRDEIRERAKSVPYDQLLLLKLGYQRSNVTRLQRVLDDPWLGLANSEYDFIHDSAGFLLSLCEILGMDRDATAVRIEDIVERLRSESEAYRPWLHVESCEVELASDGKGWIGRLAMSNGRNLLLGDDARCQPLERVIEMAQAVIQQHVAENQGRLKSGHRIDGYLLYHREDRPALRMNLEGTITGTGPKPVIR